MKKLFFSVALFSAFQAFSQFEPIQREDVCQVYLDLNEVKEDRLPVQFISPLLTQDSVEYHMPRIIPGTYDVHNYGRFVQDFKALTGRGKELQVRQLDQNRWRIYDASNLYKITYTVDDTYDEEEPTGIFEPAGTSLEDSVFLLNNFGFVGYLDGYKKLNFLLHIEKPKGFYGSTALRGEIGDTLDTYLLDDYFTLHDNPLMYCRPDTATRMVGGAEVLVSVYSPNEVVSASKSMEEISAVLDAAAKYLGGRLPVDKYAVLIYSVPLDEAGSSYGALEHHTSTVLYMPEYTDERFYSGVRDITSHEFFHIITPLGIHSQMIADYNFINPEMSKHIWLYEGITEYNSHLVQIRSGLYTIDEFLSVTREKMESADDYNEDIPLTVASEHTLTFLKDEYYNFYLKGSLAGMALDLKLIELSEGKYRLVNLLEDLGQVYGADTFFVDDKLFDIITEMTYPPMREFFARHFEGTEPFPFKELLKNVGVLYLPEVEVERLTVGNVEFGYSFETGRLRVESTDAMDAFGKELGWKTGDEVIEFNGQPMDLGNISEVIANFYETTEAGDKVKVLVARPDGEEGFDEKKLKAKAQTAIYTERHYLQPMQSPDAGQAALRKVWINK